MLYLFALAKSSYEVLQSRKLTAVDQMMSRLLRVKMFGFNFTVDCAYTDSVVREDSYTFGLVREIYLGNCYFRFLAPKLSDLQTVIDLGANRGIFSLLAANFAKKVICVEAQKKYIPALERNMQVNGFTHYRVENVFVGKEGVLGDQGYKAKSLDAIVAEASFDVVDLLKVDIEGSEFSLFRDTECLDRVRYITMEIHPHFGDTQEIVDILCGHGFYVVVADKNFNVLADSQQLTDIGYVYALNSHLAEMPEGKTLPRNTKNPLQISPL